MTETESLVSDDSDRADETSAAEKDFPHILLVDDDRRIRELLKKFLSEKQLRVTVAASAAEAREHLDRFEFDLLVLDIMMPGETGLELTQSLRQNSSVPILLLTARTETTDRIAGLQGGADDYLGKPFEPMELLLRINAILRRAQPRRGMEDEILFGDCQFNLKRAELRRAGILVRLTDREKDLLIRFARSPNKILSRQDLADEETGMAERTVDVQINRLRQKIEQDPRNPLHLQTVRGRGYILKAEPAL